MIAGAEVKVVPIPPAQGLVILSFATIPAALDRLAEIIATGPAAVEMVDRMMLDLAASNPDYARSLNFAEGRPAAVLAAQFYAETRAEELAGRAEDLARRFEGQSGGPRRPEEPDGVGQGRLLEDPQGRGLAPDGDGRRLQAGRVRRGHRRQPRSRLPAFYDRFAAILARNGTVGACYGHADVGCLHIRPVINVKTVEGVDQAPVDRPRGLRPGRRVRRLDERRARRRPGPERLERPSCSARGLRRLRRGQGTPSTPPTG